MPEIPGCSKKRQDAEFGGVEVTHHARVQELEIDISRIHEKLEEVNSRLLHIEKSAKLEPSKQTSKRKLRN